MVVTRLTRMSLTLDFPASQHEISQVIDKAVDVPVVAQRKNPHETGRFGLVAQVPQVRVVTKTVETP